MSADFRKEIDLIIRAQLKSGNTLTGVTKSIADLEKALEAQTAAAKRGESSIDELRATLLSLQRVQDQLKDQASLISQFERLGKQIGETADKVSKSKTAYADYKDKLDKAGKATDYQTEKLAKLARAAERNETTLAKQRTDYDLLVGSLREAGVEINKLSDAENIARQSAARLGLSIANTQKAISTYAEDVRAARDEETKRAATARAVAEEQSRLQAEETRRLADQRAFRQAITNQRLSEIKVAEDEADMRRKTAAAAEMQARGYKTLGTAAKTLTASSGGIREAISSILNPSQQARTTLEGVENEVRQIGAAVSSIKGPIENYRDQVQRLVAAQKAIAGQASLVDSYNRQMAVLRSSRAEYAQARADVLRYAEALRNSSDANDGLNAALKRAQGALDAAQRNLSSQINSARSMRDAMRQAGLSTNDLAGTQARLTTAAQSSATAMNQLNVAHKRYGDSTRDAATAHDLFASSGRTTLSYLQRLRGEVLSLVAAYAGIYGAVEGATKAIDAFNTKQGIQNQLALSAGNDQQKIAEAYEYIRQQADRIGVSFEQAAKGYSKFSASATIAGRGADEIKYIFESFMEVGRVANLSTDELDGVFKALEQIISKGTIQAEELRGQLGDRLFGAFQIAAQALKDQFPNLDKAMKEGKVTSEQLLKIAEKYREMVGPRLSEATQTLAANQARLNSALFDFKVLVAEQGFAEEYNKLITTLIEFFNSEDGTNFAKSLSDGLTLIVQTLRAIVENAELVKEILIAGLLVAGAKSAMTLGLALAAIPGKLTAIQTAATGASFAMRGLLAVFPLISAAATGWTIGAILREKFVEVRRMGIALVVGLESAWVKLKYGAQIAWVEIPAVFMDGISTVGNLLTQGMRDWLSIFAAGARALGKADLAASIDNVANSIKFRTDRIGKASADLRKNMERDLTAIQEIGWDMWQEADSPGATIAKKSGVQATAKPTKINPSQHSPDEKDAEKRLKLKEKLEAQLAQIDARIERQEKDNLKSRVEAINDEYYKLMRDIAKLGGAEGKQMGLRLEADIELLVAQETRKFEKKLADEQRTIEESLSQIEAAIGRKQKTDLQARLDAVKDQYSKHYADIQELREKLTLNERSTAPADLMTLRLDAGIKELQNLETQKYYEEALNVVLEERKAKINTINEQEKAGLLTATQARERAAEVVSQTQPKIEAITAAGLEYVDTMIKAAEATGANVTALETLRAKLIEGRESAKGLKTEFISAAQVNEMLANGATSAFETMATAIGDAIAGVHTWEDAITSIRNAFLKFAADFLMQIAKMILQQTILNALKDSGAASGGIGGVIASAIGGMMGAGVKHTGGVVGSTGTTRVVPSAWFANAPRYHGGGIAGLAPDEYPTILKKNEEVLTANDPRNVMNGGSGQAQQNIKIMNMIDSGSVISEGLASEPGSKAIFNFMRANRTGLKQILGTS